MDPLSVLVMAGNALTIGSQVAGAFQGNSAGKAAAKQSMDEAAVASDQAARAEGQARRERDVFVGSQVAAAGASGVALEGSPSSVIVDSAVAAEMRALNERYKGAVEATGLRNQAKSQKLAGQQALTGGLISAVGGAALRGSKIIAGGFNQSTSGYKLPDGSAPGTYVLR